MKISKFQLRQIVKETLKEAGTATGGQTGGLAAIAGGSEFQDAMDSPDAFLQRPSTPDSAIQGAAHEFFVNLGITDADVVRALVSNIAIPDLKEIMRVIPKLDTAAEESQ
tara:strand:- start:15 stop:344 length:330 start_codon:yes stop_codon:yes gene_type:complete